MSDDDDDFPPMHPDADKFTCPGWATLGRCICGAELPAMRVWNDAGSDWSWIKCVACGRGYVDEEEYTAIYEADEWAAYDERESGDAGTATGSEQHGD